jgi:Family of unknown function (DUF6662)
MNKNAAILTVTVALGATTFSTRADEQLFGFVRGAETLPKGRSEVYQFITMRTGKAEGSYYGFDFETEIEHGFTDKWQGSFAVEQRYINNHGVDGDRDALDDFNGYRFGGLIGSTKYRLWSPFKDPLGVALRLEGGYLWYDEVGGLQESETFIAPELDLQKNFRDDTIICNLNLGAEWAWGKKPAEEYPRELSLQGGAGVAYRFAPNWFIGAEATVRSEWPMFDFGNFEHAVVYTGPSLHYSSKRWWVTLTGVYQVWGNGVDEPNDGKTYAEETTWKVRLKVGFNF